MNKVNYLNHEFDKYLVKMENLYDLKTSSINYRKKYSGRQSLLNRLHKLVGKAVLENDSR